MARLDNYRALVRQVLLTSRTFKNFVIITEDLDTSDVVRILRVAMRHVKATVSISDSLKDDANCTVIDVNAAKDGGFSHYLYVWIIPSSGSSQFRWIVVQEPLRMGALDRETRLRGSLPSSVTGTLFFAPATTFPFELGENDLMAMLSGIVWAEESSPKGQQNPSPEGLRNDT